MSGSVLPVVMVVDDEPRMLSALRRGLRREPIEIVTAENASVALDFLAEREIVLVISDHKMPGMNGIEFLAMVRRRWPETRRILLSGWSTEIPAPEIEAAGLAAQFAKPWDDAELRRAIRDAVGI